MSEGCSFCRMAKGLEPSWAVYEDDLIKAFLDTNPVSEGHTLIITKGHYETIYEIPEGELKRAVVAAKRLAEIYKSALGANATNILHASGKEAQQSVPHFHIHLVPRYEGDGLNLWYKAKPRVRAGLDRTLRKIKPFMSKSKLRA